jgi:hypothetical protein
MPPSVFISYSRRESPFVDVLLEALEKSGLEVWADYRSLVPARPWLEQIIEAINAADVFLLVISRESLGSRNIEAEYRHALIHKKRVVLLIFEAAPLPADLQGCEWIDFRGSFWWPRRKLVKLLRAEPSGDRRPAPHAGFRTSPGVWLAFWVSLLAVVISVPAWWTIYIPILLVPLPAGILRREFHFYRTRFAVLTLPVVLLLSWILFLSYPQIQPVTSFCLLASLVVTPLLLALLSSRAMRMWGKPIASVPRFANPYRPKAKQPEPVPFFIEHAPEDHKYAEALARALRKHGHPQVNSAFEAQADFVIISPYKTSTLIDPEKRVVYPVIIQDAPVTDAAIRRVPWIDFRRGVRHLDSLARLLPEPARLLKAMGVAPISEQTLNPRIIQLLDYYLILLGFFSVSAWLPLLAELGVRFVQLPNQRLFFAANIILSALILLSVLTCRRALLHRAGWLSAPGGLIGSILWVGALGFLQCYYIIVNVVEAATLAGAVSAALQEDMRGSVALFFPISYILGLVLIAFLALWNWGDFSRWFPVRVKKAK